MGVVKANRYAVIYQRVKNKNPNMSHKQLHSATKYLLSKNGYYGNWHKDTRDCPGWIFPINQNTTIRLNLNANGKEYGITLIEHNRPDEYLGRITAKSLTEAKLHSIKICAKHMSHNAHLFQESWESLWKLIYQKGGRYTQIANASPMPY